MPPGSDRQSQPGTPDRPSDRTASGANSSALIPTTECPNCGRRFASAYCPRCGQEANPSRSVLGVLSTFFREFVDLNGGLWPTVRDLTLRPGRALSDYLRGATKSLMHPGRYLLAAIVVAFAARQASIWIGARVPYTAKVSGVVSNDPSSEVDPETTRALQSVVVSIADQVMESQSFLVASSLLLAGLLSLTVWRLFRPRFERGAQAVAFSVFTVAHAVFLTTALRCLYVPAAYAGSGKAVAPPSLLVYGTTATYTSIAVSRALGGGLKAAAKGLLALFWAASETGLLLGIAIGAYFFWRARTQVSEGSSIENPTVSFEANGTTLELGALGALGTLLLPFLVHAGIEAYYRLR